MSDLVAPLQSCYGHETASSSIGPHIGQCVYFWSSGTTKVSHSRVSCSKVGMIPNGRRRRISFSFWQYQLLWYHQIFDQSGGVQPIFWSIILSHLNGSSHNVFLLMRLQGGVPNTQVDIWDLQRKEWQQAEYPSSRFGRQRAFMAHAVA